ncbi:MAG: hypothetical protein ACLSFT_01235 [Ruminococcus callidus]
MKTLKKVAAVLAASMALNAVAFTGAFSASAEEDVTVIGTASLKGQMGTYGYWGEGNTGNSEDLTNKPVQITNEDKQYTASWEITGDGTGSIEFLMLEFDTNDDHFITKDTYPDLAITIDSVKVDGNEVDYKMSDNAVDYKYYANDTGTTRAYLLNTWNASGRKVTDISAETAVAQSVEVTFSVANVYAAPPYGDLNEDGIDHRYEPIDGTEGRWYGFFFDERKPSCRSDGNYSLDRGCCYLLLYCKSGAGITVDPFCNCKSVYLSKSESDTKGELVFRQPLQV